MCVCSVLERSAGRFFGPHNPYHDANAKPFTPDSSTVGMSGAAAARLRLVRPSALILPLSASGQKTIVDIVGHVVVPIPLDFPHFRVHVCPTPFHHVYWTGVG